LSAKIHDVETNTGVNLPIRFTPLSGEAGGEWFEEILHGDIVEETKRNNFGLLIIAFVALGRLHNILESAGGVFPSFYPDLAKDDGYLAKFITLNDYLSHSKKVLTEIKSRGLPSSPDSFLCPMSYEVLPPAAPNYSSDFMRMFNLLVNYNAYINQLLDNSPEHRFALSSAYEVLNNGESPLVYLADDLPAGMDRLNDFLIGKFEKIASELFPSGILYENLSPFLRKKQRIELLPSFIALYKAVLEIYKHFKNMIGVSAAMTEKTNRHSKSGKPFGIRVSAAEFSVIVTECEKLALLSKLQIESPVNHHTALTRIAAVLINDEEKAAQLIEYLTQERNIAYSHWEHLEQVMMFLYETSRQSKSMLFDFGKSTNTPPLLPNQLLQNFKAQAELKLSNVAKQTSQAIFRQRQYKKDGFGFVMSRGGMYITRFWGGDIYFQHTDGYHVSSKGELKIFD
jgi:hypothetical protein